MYKDLNNETPEYLSSKFIFYVWTQRYKLKKYGEKEQAVPLPRTEHFKKSFSYSGSLLRNSLLDHLRWASSLTSLKSSIRCHNFEE